VNAPRSLACLVPTFGWLKKPACEACQLALEAGVRLTSYAPGCQAGKRVIHSFITLCTLPKVPSFQTAQALSQFTTTPGVLSVHLQGAPFRQPKNTLLTHRHSLRSSQAHSFQTAEALSQFTTTPGVLSVHLQSTPFRQPKNALLTHRHSLRTSQAHSFRTAQSLSQFTATPCYSLSTPTHTPDDKAQHALPTHRHSLRTSLDHSSQTAQSLSQLATTSALLQSTFKALLSDCPIALLIPRPLFAILCPPSRVLLNTRPPLPLLIHHPHLLHARLAMIGAKPQSTAQVGQPHTWRPRFLLCKNPNKRWPRHLFLASLLSRIRVIPILHPGSYLTSGHSFFASGTLSSHPVTLSHIRSRR